MADLDKLQKDVVDLNKLQKEFDDILEKTLQWNGKIILETMGGNLEKYYYWLLNFLGKNGKLAYDIIWKTEEKAASVFSALFGEMGMRKTTLEKRAMEIFQIVNTVIQSINRILYDLREYDRLLKIHADMKSSNKDNAEASRLSAKRIFMDEVDIKKGRGSINQLSAGQLEFVTLRDAFMKANSMSDIRDLDLNDRVRRILMDRIKEYLDWLPEWETQLKQQKSLLLSYLKSQHDAFRLYIRWLEPYLKSIKRLEFTDPSKFKNALIDVFDTNIIVLDVFGVGNSWTGFYDEILQGWAPGKGFPMTIKEAEVQRYRGIDTGSEEEMERADIKKRMLMGPLGKKLVRLKFTFTAKPFLMSRDAGHGAYRQMGHLKMEFFAHGFDEAKFEKLIKIKEELEKEEENLLIASATGSLKAIQKDLDHYIKEFEGKKEKKVKEKRPLMFTEIFDSLKRMKFTSEKKEGEKKKPFIFEPFKKYRHQRAELIARLGAQFDGFDIYNSFKGFAGLAQFGMQDYFRGI